MVIESGYELAPDHVWRPTASLGPHERFSRLDLPNFRFCVRETDLTYGEPESTYVSRDRFLSFSRWVEYSDGAKEPLRAEIGRDGVARIQLPVLRNHRHILPEDLLSELRLQDVNYDPFDDEGWWNRFVDLCNRCFIVTENVRRTFVQDAGRKSLRPIRTGIVKVGLQIKEALVGKRVPEEFLSDPVVFKIACDGCGRPTYSPLTHDGDRAPASSDNLRPLFDGECAPSTAMAPYIRAEDILEARMNLLRMRQV